MGIRAKIRNLAEDITTLEVNTVLKSEMTARKMPRPRYALIEVASAYYKRLEQLAPPYRRPEQVVCHVDAFDEIRAVADRQIKAPVALPRETAEEREARLVMLQRIKRNCDAVRAMLRLVAKRKDAYLDEPGADRDRIMTREVPRTRFWVFKRMEPLPPLPLEADELVLLRKVWDMGTEQVVMQTLVQLDGDVLTRIVPRYATAESRVLQQIHRDGVQLSLEMWQTLVATLGAFFRTILKAVRPF